GWITVDGAVETMTVAGDEPLRAELAAFLAACDGRGPNLADAAAGVHALAIVDGAALSARAGREVSLSEVELAC
ncbi:MAG TPA: Gfo/Idh/MocA family oxidoreductase, partial [Myxococcaceae bacterium]|nr:Gfo/Idh/MocA family oxidoreductase [Myxococcaceae bacterium]